MFFPGTHKESMQTERPQLGCRCQARALHSDSLRKQNIGIDLFQIYKSICNILGNSALKTGGETEDEKVRVDIIENQAMDFRNGFVRMCYTDLVGINLIILAF